MTKTEERDWVRELARQVAEIAGSPEMEARRQRWRDVYMLRKPDRAPVWFKARDCRAELLPEKDLQCQDPFLRDLEYNLKLFVLYDQFKDDAVVNPYWSVSAVVERDSEHLWGVEIKHHQPDAEGGAWAYDPPIKCVADLNRLRMPTWRHNEELSQRVLEQHQEVFGDVLPVRQHYGPRLGAGLANHASDLIGLDNLLLNMAADPDFVHGVMAFLRDATLKHFDEIEAMGVLTENNTVPTHFSDSLKTSPPDEPVHLSDMWCWTESQPFENVGPDMWKEFCLDYQAPIMARYRHVSYGCCENLNSRIDHVLSIPNLRVFVNGPWTDWGTTIDKCGDHYSLVWRQMATDIIYADDLAPLRKHLVEGLKRSQGCFRSIHLQEVQTMNGNPERFKQWAVMAKEVSEEFSA